VKLADLESLRALGQAKWLVHAHVFATGKGGCTGLEAELQRLD
jgi:hypothetical protein